MKKVKRKAKSKVESGRDKKKKSSRGGKEAFRTPCVSIKRREWSLLPGGGIGKGKDRDLGREEGETAGITS